MKMRLAINRVNRLKRHKPIKVAAPHMMGFMKAYKIRNRMDGINRRLSMNLPISDVMTEKTGALIRSMTA
jgi:hypothetical protein